MSEASVNSLTVSVRDDASVSALLCSPPNPQACYVFAHGAGAGMNHEFMAAIASEFAKHAVATLRYQFEYMERGSKRPDPPKLAHLAVRAAVAKAADILPDVPMFAGGKSFGGRMTSQAQAETPIPGIRGLVFFGFPLHPAGKPSIERAAHLLQVDRPMLFLQGTRDELADLSRLREAIAPLHTRATLEVFEDADHSFHVRARSGRRDDQVRASLVEIAATWMGRVLG